MLEFQVEGDARGRGPWPDFYPQVDKSDKNKIATGFCPTKWHTCGACSAAFFVLLHTLERSVTREAKFSLSYNLVVPVHSHSDSNKATLRVALGRAAACSMERTLMDPKAGFIRKTFFRLELLTGVIALDWWEKTLFCSLRAGE